MYEKDKRSFFEKLTGTINIEEDEVSEEPQDEEEEEEHVLAVDTESNQKVTDKAKNYNEQQDEDDTEEDGELAVDVYENNDEVFVQAMVAGVEPGDLNVEITREMVKLKGKREKINDIPNENYYHRELYWGNFSRKILLPEEIDPEKSEAIEKHGLLILRLPKLNKKKSQKLAVKAL